MNKFVEKYGQILLPLVTPYDENENVKYDTYAELIEYLIEKDMCDSLIVTGTTGEASLLTFDERVKLFETAVKASAGRKPVIYPPVGPTNTPNPAFIPANTGSPSAPSNA